MLRLFEDTLAPGAACALPARPRVLYVRAGGIREGRAGRGGMLLKTHTHVVRYGRPA